MEQPDELSHLHANHITVVPNDAYPSFSYIILRQI